MPAPAPLDDERGSLSDPEISALLAFRFNLGEQLLAGLLALRPAAQADGARCSREAHRRDAVER